MTTTKTEQREAKGKALALGFLVVVLVAAGLLLAAEPAHAATTFTVNSTGDENDLDFPGGTFDGSSDGKCDINAGTTGDQCTLRAAIQQANRSSGADTIEFDIPGTGGHTISPASPLPAITKRVTIDGYTQSGAAENTIAQGAINAQLAIELDGHGGGAGLQLNGPDASNSVIRGLVINRFFFGIYLLGGTGYQVEGNFIGTHPSGTFAESNQHGVIIQASNSTLGGTSPAARNLISGNDRYGIHVGGEGGNKIQGNKIQGNLIGTDKNGIFPLGNGVGSGVGSGVLVVSSSNAIGDSDPSDGATNAANTIAFNGFDGVGVDGGNSTGNRILSNSIFSNSQLGIDLRPDGVTANDDKDTDMGPNRMQNYPLITSATTSNQVGTIINGTLESTPSTKKKKRTFTIQFFSNPAADPSGYGEGQTFLGETRVKTDRQGKASFSFAPTQEIPEGQFVTATATRNSTGDTSEFSEARVVEGPVIGGG